MNKGIKQKVKKTDYLLILTIVIFIFGLFLFRPYQLKEAGLLYAGDDEGYFAHSTSLVFFKFPSYEKEYWQEDSNYPRYGIGPAIMSYPFTASFSIIDRLNGSSIIEERNRQTIIDSWTLFGFILSTFFYFYIGMVLIYFGLNYHFDEKTSFFSILFLILFQYIPLYVFRRPVFSHIYEFALQSILIFILLKNLKTGFLENTGKKIVIFIGLVAGLIFLVRYNNILFTIIWPIILFSIKDGKFYFKKSLPKLFLCYLITIAVILIFKLIPGIYYNDLFGQASYLETVNYRMFSFNGILFYLNMLFRIFFWYDWGLFFTAPFAIIGLIYIIRLKPGTRLPFALLLLPLLLNIYIIMSWGNQGSWYGYRFIIFSLIPIVSMSFASFIRYISKKIGYKKLLIVLFIVSILSVFSMLAFEGNASSLNLNKIYSWGNSTYQLEIWRIIFTKPSVFISSIAKGGLSYLISIFADVFRLKYILPDALTNIYPKFNQVIFIKTMVIYIFPFILYFIIRSIQNRQVKLKNNSLEAL